jgi:hypothetical protein
MKMMNEEGLLMEKLEAGLDFNELEIEEEFCEKM